MAHVKARQTENTRQQGATPQTKPPATTVHIDVRAEVERELAVLRLPGAEEKLRAAFEATPSQIAAAANAARARRKR